MKKMLLLLLLGIFVGCQDTSSSGDRDNGGINNPKHSVSSITSNTAPEEECPYGGITVYTGIDENGNDVLDEIEIDNTQYVCNGESGAQGDTGAQGETANSLSFPDGTSGTIKNFRLVIGTDYTVPSGKTLYIHSASIGAGTSYKVLTIGSENAWQVHDVGTVFASPMVVIGGSTLAASGGEIYITGHEK